MQAEFSAGDILFYGQGNGDVADKLIRDWTNSPLVHVAIALSDVEKVEALAHGVVRTPIMEEDVAAHWQFQTQGGSLANGLHWLTAQIGRMYGWGDILDALLWKFEHNVAIDTQHFDCSSLATEFLLKCGGVPGLEGVTDPHVITPARLAELLRVTP